MCLGELVPKTLRPEQNPDLTPLGIKLSCPFALGSHQRCFLPTHHSCSHHVREMCQQVKHIRTVLQLHYFLDFHWRWMMKSSQELWSVYSSSEYLKTKKQMVSFCWLGSETTQSNSATFLYICRYFKLIDTSFPSQSFQSLFMTFFFS